MDMDENDCVDEYWNAGLNYVPLTDNTTPPKIVSNLVLLQESQIQYFPPQYSRRSHLSLRHKLDISYKLSILDTSFPKRPCHSVLFPTQLSRLEFSRRTSRATRIRSFKRCPQSRVMSRSPQTIYLAFLQCERSWFQVNWTSRVESVVAQLGMSDL